jgi:5-methylcytosine-specific restriction protein A
MMEGTEYQRTINKEATEYYLENIYKDFGVNQLQKATHALSLHIEYYESLQNSTMITQRNLLERFRKIADTTDAWEDPDELGDSPSFSEGAKKNITVNSYERDPNARAHCLQHYGYTCKVCGMDFESTYGILGKNFIHVHHLIPLSDIGNGYETNPIEDLIPICPNCHAMIHKMDHTTADSIDELRFIIKIHRSSNTKQDD